MPLQKLNFRPGVNRENTNYTNEGGWYSCDKIRFRSGFPEKIGGWVRATPGQFFKGVCRALINWINLQSANLLGIGTHTKYYVVRDVATYNDITPLNKPPQTLGNNPIATMAGSSIITVTAVANLAQGGDYVSFSGVVGPTIGGIDVDVINNSNDGIGFQILSPLINSNQFQIDLGPDNVATSTTTGGGNAVVASFQLNIGLPSFAIGTGWGAGVWNGTNRTVSANLVQTPPATGIVYLNATSTTVNVDSTVGFTNSGYIQIENEIIQYTGITPTSFTGCTRGASLNGSSSPATNHAVNPIPNPRPIEVYQVIGLLGTTGWGLASDVNFGVGQQLRLWTHDNFGEDLLLAPRGGKVYYWENNTATYPRAVTLSSLANAAGFDPNEVPVQTNQILVSDVSRFVIAMGSQAYDDPTATFNPMLVRWSDQENPYQWIPLSTNQAGEQPLSNGSYIMCAKKSRQEILIWTDSAIYSMQYLGPPYVWGIGLLMDNISIMSPNAVATANNMSFWMGTDKFYVYSGRVDTLPCSVRQYIFQDLAFSQRFQVVAGTNEGFSEIWWYYVSNEEVARADAEQRVPSVDKYVIYNHLDKVWYYGRLNRTAWLDSPLQDYPLAAIGTTEEGTLLFHELGVDDAATASPQPIEAFIESSDFDIGDGFNFGFVWRIIPDITFAGSTDANPQVNMSLLGRRNSGTNYQGVTALNGDINATQTTIPVLDTTTFPTAGLLLIGLEKISYTGKTPTTFTGCVRGAEATTALAHKGNTEVNQYQLQLDVTKTATYPVEQFTGQVYTRLRARQMGIRVASTKLGTTWQLGSPRIDIKPDGRR